MNEASGPPADRPAEWVVAKKAMDEAMKAADKVYLGVANAQMRADFTAAAVEAVRAKEGVSREDVEEEEEAAEKAKVKLAEALAEADRAQAMVDAAIQAFKAENNKLT